MQDQFAKEWRDVNHAAISRQQTRKTGSDIERSDENRAQHLDTVLDTRRDPNGAVRRNNPRTSRSVDGHDTARSIDKLVPLVRMRMDYMSGRAIDGQGADLKSVFR